MKQLLIMFAGLVWATTTQAASFDCAKAGTKVEHIICDNQEISKLDDEMAASYKAALQNKLQAEAIKQAQMQWLKDRNDCMDAACVQSAYQKRVDQLRSTQNVAAQAQTKMVSQHAVQAGGVSANGSSVGKKYPPYPDVWQWEFLVDSDIEAEQLFLVSNGDVLTHNKLLFGGQTTTYTPDAFFPLDVDRDKGVVQLNDGTQVGGAKASAIGRIQLSNGWEVVSNENVFGKCYHGPIRYSLQIYDRKNHIYKANKVIFIILDKPKQNIWNQPKTMPGSKMEEDPCTEEGPPGYVTPVESMSGSWMLPLDDGTFILSLGGGLVVRFDGNFNTNSPLLNRRFFVFDFNDSKLFIDQINSKKYNLRKTGYQPVFDDLYKYLTSLRGK